METVIRTAEQVVENRSAQTAVITILPHSFKNVNRKYAHFYDLFEICWKFIGKILSFYE